MDEDAAWSAMQRVGIGIAQAVVRDFQELRPVPQNLRVLALVGKGNNGGDALIACGRLLADFPRASVTLLCVAEPGAMRPLAQKAFKQLEGRVQVYLVGAEMDAAAIHQLLDAESAGHGFDICLDGLLGMAFKAPVREFMRALIEAINGYDRIALRASVDLPSGKGDESDMVSFRAEFSYATGIAKRVLFDGLAECGRVRLIDLGLFRDKSELPEVFESLLTPQVLDPLRRLRPAAAEKRTYGHIFVVGGSAHMPGALLMSVQAAIRSGVGLVTAFAPASVTAALSAQVPEAMWVPWPETVNGTLNPKAFSLLQERLNRASAVLIGPGMGKDRFTEMLVQDVVKQVDLPIIMDADALRLRALELIPKRKSNAGPVILTPHMGEFMRLAKLNEPDYSTEILMNFSRINRLITVLKGSQTRICDGQSVLYSSFGGPVLSRGGTGDLLAGLIGGMVAQDSASAWIAAARGIVLHGMAGECLARQQGQVMVHSTQLLDYLPEVLRSGA